VRKNKKKILWFTWKDMQHPQAGGAELVNEELAKRLVRDGCEVTFVVGGFSGGKSEEVENGYKIIRLGNRWTLYWQAYRYYKKNLRGWADIVIEEVNTIPFFTRFYVKEKRILIIYQLCREIWFHQMFFPLSLIGFLLEPFYIRLLRKDKVITISESSKKDLRKMGFEKEQIEIISVGIETEPLHSLLEVKKYTDLTVLSLGAIRGMKRTQEQIEAFTLAKEKIPKLKMKIAGGGSGKYYEKMRQQIAGNPYAKDIEYLGRVSEKEKVDLMQKCHLILVTSLKEGWGLIVTEANSQGTPAIVYNVDGLRDSVKDGITGIVCKINSPKDMAGNIVKLLKDKNKYENFRKNGWEWSKEINFDKCYKDFIKINREKAGRKRTEKLSASVN